MTQSGRFSVFDSWQILPATEEIVFAEDTDAIWRTLLPPRQFRAAADRMKSGVRDLEMTH